MTEHTFGGRKRHKTGTGGVVGVGYISIMLIFTVICLTIFAVLSFQAAYSNNRLSERGVEFTRQYYAADMQAKKILSQLDLKAAEITGGFDFTGEFVAAAQEISGGSAQKTVQNGVECVRVEFTAPVNDRVSLSVSVLFRSAWSEKRYEILGWKTTTTDISDDSRPNVWNGGELG